MASVCRARSVLQLSRLSAALQALSYRRDWTSFNLRSLHRSASSSTSGETTKNVSVSIREKRSKEDEELRQVISSHVETNDQKLPEDKSKSRKSWQPASKKGKENVIRKVLPGRGEAKAVSFRLGKKFVTAENARERSLANDCLIESDNGASGGAAVDMPKARAGHQMEATSELINALTKNLSLTQKDLNLFSDSLPSIFGMSVGRAKQVAIAMNKAGLTKSDVGIVFPKFPHILDIDYENVARIFTMLNFEYKMNRLWLVGLMKNHPYVFTLDEEMVRERVDVLFELGLQRHDIGELIRLLC